MSMSLHTNDHHSPFHAGEQAMQTRTGHRERSEALGTRMIRSFMPAQHQAFFAQLPFVVAGHVDSEGQPWASLISGAPGFMSSPDDTTLVIEAAPHPHDSLAPQVDQPIGLLGIELPTRRRNRMNGRVAAVQPAAFTVHVDQSFGNCPKYIQQRDVEYVAESAAEESGLQESFTELSQEAQNLIRHADTFFVASYVNAAQQPAKEGVDVSHRGGQPGFVRVDDNQLLVPDFAGNHAFNTLGNFLVNPQAGLVFPNFDNGDVLQLTGSVEVLDETDSADDSLLRNFEGAERGWRFTTLQGRWLRRALPLRFAPGDASPFNAVTGTWLSH